MDVDKARVTVNLEVPMPDESAQAPKSTNPHERKHLLEKRSVTADSVRLHREQQTSAET